MEWWVTHPRRRIETMFPSFEDWFNTPWSCLIQSRYLQSQLLLLPHSKMKLIDGRKKELYPGEVDVFVERPIRGAIMLLATVVVQACHLPLRFDWFFSLRFRLPLRYALFAFTLLSLFSLMYSTKEKTLATVYS